MVKHEAFYVQNIAEKIQLFTTSPVIVAECCDQSKQVDRAIEARFGKSEFFQKFQDHQVW